MEPEVDKTVRAGRRAVPLGQLEQTGGDARQRLGGGVLGVLAVGVALPVREMPEHRPAAPRVGRHEGDELGARYDRRADVTERLYRRGTRIPVDRGQLAHDVVRAANGQDRLDAA